MADEEIILRVEADTGEAVKNIDLLTEAIEQNRSETSDLQADQKKLESQGKRNGEQWNKNAKEIALNRSSLQGMNRERKNAINVTQSETKTLSQLRATLNTLKQQRNDNIAVGSKEFDATTKRIASLNTEIKAAEQAGGDFQRSVGNYSTALDGATQSIDAIIPGFGGMVQGLQGMTKAALAFIATPLGAVLALIALALQSVAVFFSRTAEGQEELAKKTARLTSFLETFLDVVSAVGKYLFSIFIPIIKTVVDLFVAQFHAVQAVARALKGDFKGALVSSKAAIDDVKSAFDNLSDGVNASIDNFNELTTSINESVQAAEGKSQISQQLAVDEFRLTEQIIKNTVAEARRTKQIAELILASKDETTSIEERTAALDKANELELKNLKDTEAILAEELRIAAVRDSLHDSTIEDLQAVANAEAKLLQFQTQSFNRQRNLINRSNTLIKEQETLRKKNEADRVKRQTQQEKDRETRMKAEEKAAKLETARLQKESDLANQILQIKKQREIEAATSNEDRINREIELENLKFEQLLSKTELSALQIEVITLNHENALAAITQKGADQIAAIELKAFKQTDALRKQNEALDKQSKQNFISLTAQVFSEASDLARDNAVASKLFAGAAATINTLQAITKTLAVGGAFAIPSAIAVGALGFAQVAKIASTSVDAPTTTPGGSGLSGIAQPINVDTGGLDRGISDNQILENALEGISAQISITELNRVQNKVSVAERDSKLV